MRWQSYVVIFLLNVSLAIGIAYTAITKVDLDDPSLVDTQYYVKIFKGAPLRDVNKPYCYRFITPTLARLVPSPPQFIHEIFDIDSEKEIKYKFGLINVLAIGIAALFLFKFCLHLNLSLLASLLADLFFILNFFVINYAFLPMVDAVAYCSLIICFYAIISDRNWILATIFTIGMFVKETMILGIIYILLRRVTANDKINKVLICVPGLAGYFLFRFVFMPTNLGYGYSWGKIVEVNSVYLASMSSWYRLIIEAIFSFGFLWILAIKGWIITKDSRYMELRSMIPILPFIVLMPFLLCTNHGRIWFLAFPLILPLATIGAESILNLALPTQNKKIS